MKKLLFVLFAFVLFVLVTPSSFAKEKDKEDKSAKDAEVLGTVLNCNEKLAYVNVTATCGSQTFNGQTGSTGGDMGKYSLTFKNSSCKNGSTVSVSANVNGTNYSNSGTMGSFLWFKSKAWVDIQTGKDCGSDPQVPEFGPITGAIAAVGSAGSYLLLRRRAA